MSISPTFHLPKLFRTKVWRAPFLNLDFRFVLFGARILENIGEIDTLFVVILYINCNLFLMFGGLAWHCWYTAGILACGKELINMDLFLTPYKKGPRKTKEHLRYRVHDTMNKVFLNLRQYLIDLTSVPFFQILKIIKISNV
jgi:hypothetical protein